MQMTFGDALKEVKRQVPCIQYLHKAPRGGLVCPFCGSGTGPHGTGAMEYYSESNTFFCHACSKSGDPVDLYANETGRDFRDAVIDLALSIGIEVTGNKTEIRGHTATQSNSKNQRHNIPDKTAGKDTGADMSEKKADTKDRFRSYGERCRADVGNTDFFRRRGLSDEIISRFNLGYDKDYDAAVIPYNDSYTYIQARRINPEDGQRKYNKPSEAEAGGKEPLYNPDALYTGQPCFVTEGTLDALAVAEAGGNACAVCGGGINKLIDQLSEKWPISPIILLFDMDKQGQDDTERAGKKLTEAGIPFSAAKIDPEKYSWGSDPNDLLLANRAQFTEDIKANEAGAVPVSDVGQFLDVCYTERFKPYPTGLKVLDDLLDGGIMRQTLNIVMAEAGTGKTTLLQTIFENFAESGFPCIFYNLEMSKNQLIARALSRTCYTELNAPIPVRKVLRGYEQTESERDAVAKAAEKYTAKTGGRLCYNPGNTGADLSKVLDYITAIGENARTHGIQAPALCIDYLHLLRGDKGESAQDTIKRAVMGFKDYAEKYNTFVFLISAQNRPASESKKPSLSAGRDSSAIEYSGDLVLQLIRDEVGTGDYNNISLHVVKSRFTDCDKYKRLDFTLYGNYAYMEPHGEWIQGSAGEIAFTDAI